jgi:hypothetical protein
LIPGQKKIRGGGGKGKFSNFLPKFSSENFHLGKGRGKAIRKGRVFFVPGEAGEREEETDMQEKSQGHT